MSSKKAVSVCKERTVKSLNGGPRRHAQPVAPIERKIVTKTWTMIKNKLNCILNLFCNYGIK